MITKFNSNKFRICAKEALVASSIYICEAILGQVDLSGALVKGDKTAVTIVDHGSQEQALPIIQRAFPEYSINPEEGPASGNDSSTIKIYFDPLDGTSCFLIGGSTPTVILAAYDQEKKKVLACATMEPITGKFFISIAGEGAYLERFDYTKKEWQGKRKLSVNNTQFGQKLPPHVLLDATHPFNRMDGKRKILTQEGRRNLTSSIEKLGAKEANFFTNGGNYALTALGNPTVIGNITTAIGGPFDIAGILHVLEAGGAIECYKIVDETRDLIPIGEDIEAEDITIAANSPENLFKLKEIIKESVYYK